MGLSGCDATVSGGRSDLTSTVTVGNWPQIRHERVDGAE